MLYIMGEKGYAVLDAILQNYKHLIAGVISEKDKSLKDDFYASIQSKCAKENIPFYHRQDNIEHHATYAFAVGWRWLLYLEDTEIIIFHDSLLPKYRGFNPLVSYLLNEETTIGVTALFAHKDFDCGDIIDQKSTIIEYPIKLKEAIQKIIPCYVDLVLKICKNLSAGTRLQGTPQLDDEATYSLWRDEEDYNIDWTADAVYIKRFIDSLGLPYKGASTTLNGQKIRIIDSQVVPERKIENRSPGKIIFKQGEYPVVVCGQGLLKLLSICDDESGEELIPLKKFRSRFGI